MPKSNPAQHAKLGRGVRHIVVISDEHVGCQYGLLPPTGVFLESGSKVPQSVGQKFLWSCWREFWDKFVPEATNGEPYVVVNNGDVIEGSHHRSTHQWSQNIGQQVDAAVALLEPILQKCSGRMYFVKGTEAHVGQAGTDEERVAKMLKIGLGGDNQAARWDLWMELQGHVIHFLHHISGTSSPAHEATAINTEMVMELVESARWGYAPPHCVVRSHRHRCMGVFMPAAHGLMTSCVSPAWQLKTPYVWKIGGRLQPPQVGGLVISASKQVGLYIKTFVRTPSQSKRVIV